MNTTIEYTIEFDSGVVVTRFYEPTDREDYYRVWDIADNNPKYEIVEVHYGDKWAGEK